MNFTLENIRINVSAKDLLEELPEDVIYKYYCSSFPDNITHSPFRKDRNPSFSFFYKDRWLWKDFKTGEGGDIFKFVGKMENLQRFSDILHFLYMKFSSNFSTKFEDKIFEASNKQKKRQRLLQVVKKDSFSIEEIAIWKKWDINTVYLTNYYIGSAWQVFLNKELIWQTKSNNPIFYYYFPWSKNIKCYRPVEPDKKNKFLGVINNKTDIQGLYQCNIEYTKPRILVLTKAMKEVVFFRTFGIHAIAIHGENHYFSEEIISYLKMHCTYLISFYDNDLAGYHGAWMLRKQFQIPCMFLPLSYKAKNITDLWEIDYKKCYGIIDFIATFRTSQNQLNKYKNIIKWNH